MKKYIFLLLSIIASVASAQTVVNDKWEFKKTEDGWTLTKFNGTAADTDVTLPDCVIVNGACVMYSRVATFAFRENPYIKKLTITPNITYMGSSAISQCTALTELVFTDKDILGNYVNSETLQFEYCSVMGYLSPIKKIYIGRNIDDANSLGERNELFSCQQVTELIFGPKVTEIVSCVGSFPDLKSLTIPSNVNFVGESAFQHCSNIDNLIIEDSESPLSVGVYAFPAYFSNLHLGRRITHNYIVGDFVSGNPCAFAFTPNLTDLTFGTSILELWDNSFSSSQIENIIIPDNIQTIGKRVFYNSKFKTAKIGSGLKSIGDYSFDSTSELTDVSISAITPPICGISTFSQRYYAKLNIPVNAYSAYKNSDSWQHFKSLCYDGHPFVMDLTVDTSTLNLQVGQSSRISATVTPTDAYNKTLEWTSSDSYVASVDENGYVNAKHVGEATITCKTTDGSNLSHSIVVDVRSALVSEIQLNYGTIILFEDSDFQIKATVLPNDAASKAIVWTSSNPTIASIDQNGTGHTYNEGTCTITATALDGSMVSASCEIVVKPVLVTNISLNYTSLNLIIGDSKTLEALVYPDFAKNKNIIWTSSNPSIAEVNSDGIVTALKQGTAVITAKAADGSNIEATCEVNVSPILVSSITLNSSELKIALDETYQLICDIQPADATYKTINWTSSASDVAAVTDGFVQPLKVGRTVIVASTTDGTNLSAYCIAEVTEDAGIYSVSVDTSLYVTTSNGTISVVGASDDTLIALYNTSGKLVYKGYDHTVDGLNSGIYFVVVGNKSFKVLL